MHHRLWTSLSKLKKEFKDAQWRLYFAPVVNIPSLTADVRWQWLEMEEGRSVERVGKRQPNEHTRRANP